jgi:predicted nucleic acid-binding protein
MLTAADKRAPGNRLRVVLDTNVYISAFTHGGRPLHVWQSAIRGEYAVLISPPIMRELARVLRDLADWQETEIVAQLKLLARVAEIVTPACRSGRLGTGKADAGSKDGTVGRHRL